jgi:heme A synthase
MTTPGAALHSGRGRAAFRAASLPGTVDEVHPGGWQDTGRDIMRRTYTVLAWIIAAGVFVQAAAIAFGFAGMAGYVQGGGVVDKALVESQTAGNFTGELGFPIHAIVGGMVIPFAALALVVVSFLVRVPGGRKWAAIVLGLVVVQAMLGYSITDLPYLGLIHGANALAVLLSSVQAARLVARAEARPTDSTVTASASV